MELKQFITEVLTQIIEGVEESTPIYEQKGGAVAPLLGNGPVNGEMSYFRLGKSPSDTAVSVCNVHFDVSLVKTDADTKANGFSVMLGPVSARHGKDKESGEESATRVSFTIPCVLPARRANIRG